MPAQAGKLSQRIELQADSDDGILNIAAGMCVCFATRGMRLHAPVADCVSALHLLVRCCCVEHGLQLTKFLAKPCAGWHVLQQQVQCPSLSPASAVWVSSFEALLAFAHTAVCCMHVALAKVVGC
jgi:hypothetical protein